MATIFEAMAALDTIKGKSDIETHRNIKRVISIIEGQNKKWPSTELQKIVFNMNNEDIQTFLFLLREMDEGLTEYFDKEQK